VIIVKRDATEIPLSNSKLALRPIRFVGVVACGETSSDCAPWSALYSTGLRLASV